MHMDIRDVLSEGKIELDGIMYIKALINRGIQHKIKIIREFVMVRFNTRIGKIMISLLCISSSKILIMDL